MPSTWMTSTTWLEVVRVWSTPSCGRTSIRFTPSVSSIHSEVEVKPPLCAGTVFLVSRKATLRMSGTPCSLSWLSIVCSMRFRKTLSSAK